MPPPPPLLLLLLLLLLLHTGKIEFQQSLLLESSQTCIQSV